MVGADVGFIPAIISLVDPLYIRFGRLLSAGVPPVLHLRSCPQIRHPVIRWIAVLMV